MKCVNQNCDANEIEKDDNFCYKCGHWTGKGYSFLKDEKNMQTIMNGATVKQRSRLSLLGSLLIMSLIVFSIMIAIRGNNLFKPFFYLERHAFNYIYGYNTSLMKTDNKYSKKSINTYEDAISIIKSDIGDQDYYCFNELEVGILAKKMEDSYSIPSVSFCDMSLQESEKIEKVIDRIYSLFPNIQGALTNITITNASTKDEYIARFQPMYQFVNINDDGYNKVNKTQILLNSYYFLNEDIMINPLESIVGQNWYVEDANWESTIAHEFGHYISFLTLLKMNNISNITFVTDKNASVIQAIINDYNDGVNSSNILNEALNNYNNKNNTNMSLDEFASSISKYASVKNNDIIIYDEAIAEAIHDYYLHGDSMKQTSKEIVSVIKARL